MQQFHPQGTSTIGISVMNPKLHHDKTREGD